MTSDEYRLGQAKMDLLEAASDFVRREEFDPPSERRERIYAAARKFVREEDRARASILGPVEALTAEC